MNRLATMEALVRVIETGSFSGAARQLHVGQPAISKSIAQLEERLGVRLLLRSTHGLTPTEAGQSFYEHAKRSIEEADEADMAARGAGAALSGRLRICAAVTFARLHLVPHLGQFLAEHPSLDVEVVLDDRNVDLIEAGIDVALRMGDLVDSGLTARKIAQGRRLVLGTPAYFKAAGEPLLPADLTSHQAVVYDQRGGGAVWAFQQDSVKTNVTVRGRLRISAAEGIREAVLAGLGLTISSEWMFAPELQAGTVKSVLQDWTLPPIDLWAVFPTGRQASAKARAFVAFVESRMAQTSR
ncbi:LysR family transcriptional regulator [Pseudomonas tolaasii]|uniref:LysR family transcriptional regulator n=1 Tax=Pseudomonas tolaasii TaxID=29442 RepID=UPI00159FE175|nr:LysR family transcriptional regulator [Pseudomonas tolaasii]NWC25143.1 LysR family transcriptional regulator [Pseudomonas tolaasii]NWC53930.1 LysR family transcriptional regulator [Pseudomonas tolaasii]NWE62120.1 LysR family transcriptional regulator [Pseudomonas tolaasii]